MPFIVPALLYFINNNMAVIMQTEMDSATFQVGSRHIYYNFMIMVSGLV